MTTCQCMTEDPGDGLGERVVTHSSTCPEHPDPMYQVRKKPCASCPYRRDVESGIWEAEEYEKLPKFDGEIIEQVLAGATGLFMCHQTGEELCAGWVGHRQEPVDLFGIRVGISSGKLDPSVNDYTTDVPLFRSGAEAATHGLRDYENPSPRAVEIGQKIVKKRGLT